MKRWQKILLGVGVFLVLLAGFTGFVLPGIIKSQAIQRVEAATGRKLAIGRIGINPFTWVVTVEGVRYSERNGKETFASLSSARIAVSPTSIFRGAPIASEVRITAPYFHIVRTAPNTYNFSDLMEKRNKAYDARGSKPAKFSLNNITIANGSIDFVDRGLAVEKRHEVRRIGVGVPFVSTIPYYADRYIDPHFRAVVNGAPLALEGKLKPFARAAEYSLNIDLKELDIPYYVAYVPGKLPVRVDSGRLTTKFVVVYRVSQDKQPELTLTGDLSVKGLRASEPTGPPLAALQRLEVKIARAALLADQVSLSSIAAEGLELHLTRDGTGEWNFSRLMEKKPAEAPSSTPPKRTFTIEVAQTKLRGGTVHVDDALPPGGFKTEVRDVAVDLRGFSTQEGKRAEYEVAFATGRDEKGSLKGSFVLKPLAATSVVSAKGIVLETCYPYLAGILTAPLKGNLDASGEVAYSAADGITLDKGEAQITRLSVPFAGKDGASLARLTVDGVAFSQKENSVEVAAVTLQNGTVRLSRDERGNLSPLALLKGTGKEKVKGSPPTPGKKEAVKPPRYRVRSVAGNGLSLAFTDGTKREKPTFALGKASFTLANVAGPGPASIPFTVAAVYGKDGTIKAKGTVRPEPLNLKGEVTVQRIPLTDFDAYLPENLTITLADGRADARLSFALSKGKDGLTGSYGGTIGVRSFYVIDEEADDLLKWERLDLEKVRGSLSPFALEIGEVALNKYYAKVIIEKDRTLNLQHLIRRDDEETPAPDAPAQPAPPQAPQAVPQAKAATAPKSVKIGTVTFQEGTLNFTDRHLPREFSTTFYNLGGRVSGLSSEENRFADVDLRGNLENLSPLQITGTINPLRDDLFVDLTIRFKDIDLTPLTPYSGTYLGYTVDKGKLNLDLKYHIEKKDLVSENKVFIDQFTFGGKVESEQATKLPVRLAIALLKDRNGEIHLDLPVTGRTDDPKFSVWRVVLQILRNLLVKAATSPFTLLQSMFGGKEDFSSVSFAFGSTEITQPERDKLLKLAGALNDRPALKVTVTGFADRERDAEGYRNELLLKKMRAEKFRDLVKEKRNQPTDSPETVQISPDEYSRYLKAVYKKEKFPKPRTFIGLAKDLPDAEMKKLIITNTTVGDEQLHGLAQERAAAVKGFLVEKGKVDGARVFQKGGDVYKPPAKEGQVPSRVEFGAAVD